MADLSDSDDSDDDLLLKTCAPVLSKREKRKEEKSERKASALMATLLKDQTKYQEYHQRIYEQQDNGPRPLSEAERQQRMDEINKPGAPSVANVLDSNFGVPDLEELAGAANFGVRATFGTVAIKLPFKTENDALRALDKILRRTGSAYSGDKALKRAREILGNVDMVLSKVGALVVERRFTVSKELCKWLFQAALISDETSDLPQGALFALEKILEEDGENVEVGLTMDLAKQLHEWFGFDCSMSPNGEQMKAKVGDRPIDHDASSLQRWIRLWDSLVSSGGSSRQQPNCIVSLFKAGLDPVIHTNTDDSGKDPSLSNLSSLLCGLVVQLKTTDERERTVLALLNACGDLGPGEVGKDTDDEHGLMTLMLIGNLFRWRNPETSASVQPCFEFRTILSNHIIRRCLGVSEQDWSKAHDKVIAENSSWLTKEIAQSQPWNCLIQVPVAFRLFDFDRIGEDSAGCLAAIECIILNIYDTGMNYFHSTDTDGIYKTPDEAHRVAEYLAVVEAKAEKMRPPFARYAATSPHAGRAEYRLAVLKKQCRYHHVQACAAAGHESPTKVVQRTMDAFFISNKDDDEDDNDDPMEE